MFRHAMTVMAISLGVCACASVKLTERNVTVITAREAERGKGPTGITDTFSLEGRVVAHATFRWDGGGSLGQQSIEVKWYNGDKLIATRGNTFQFDQSPHHVWFGQNSIGLGPCKCRVEFYAAGRFVGSKEFIIVEKP
jgi:hypothetical protein